MNDWNFPNYCYDIMAITFMGRASTGFYCIDDFGNAHKFTKSENEQVDYYIDNGWH